MAKYSATNTLTITIAGMASSATYAGNQSDMVDNSSTRYDEIILYVKVTTGASPTGSKAVYIWLLQGDGNGVRTDGAGATATALTRKNADLLKTIRNTSGSNETLVGTVAIKNPGPEWGIAISHDTVVALNATAGNHQVSWVGVQY